MKDLLALTKSFVDKSFDKQLPHYRQTLYWILQLNPEADLACQIAAYSHDIQRAFAFEENRKKIETSEAGFKDAAMLNEHQNGGAQIMQKFLLEQGAESALAKKVAHLISKHEIGGDFEQNLLKDADSLSYFECNAPSFIERYAPIMGHAKVKAKFDWMFERISSPEAKKIAKPIYDKALAELTTAK